MSKKVKNCPMHYHDNKVKKHVCMAKGRKEYCFMYYNGDCPYLYSGRIKLLELLKQIRKKRK